MGSNPVDLVRNLAFEVEAIPHENVTKFKTSGTPLNVKIRVRKKEKGSSIQQGVIAVSKNGRPEESLERIRLASSDQTIMSFNMLMESELEKVRHKKRRTFLGVCFGSPYDDDETPYLPAQDSSRSDTDITKNKLKVTKQEAAYDSSRSTFFGKCKPGGCLDPPFGEERYKYLPARGVNLSDPLQKSLKKQSKEKIEEENDSKKQKLKNRTDDKEIKEDTVLNLYPPKNKTIPLEDSESIITYPPEENYNDLDQDKALMHRRQSSVSSNKSKKSFELESTFYTKKRDSVKDKPLSDKDKTELNDAEVNKVKLSDGRPLSDKEGHKDAAVAGGIAAAVSGGAAVAAAIASGRRKDSSSTETSEDPLKRPQTSKSVLRSGVDGPDATANLNITRSGSKDADKLTDSQKVIPVYDKRSSVILKKSQFSTKDNADIWDEDEKRLSKSKNITIVNDNKENKPNTLRDDLTGHSDATEPGNEFQDLTPNKGQRFSYSGSRDLVINDGSSISKIAPVPIPILPKELESDDTTDPTSQGAKRKASYLETHNDSERDTLGTRALFRKDSYADHGGQGIKIKDSDSDTGINRGSSTSKIVPVPMPILSNKLQSDETKDSSEQSAKRKENYLEKDNQGIPVLPRESKSDRHTESSEQSAKITEDDFERDPQGVPILPRDVQSDKTADSSQQSGKRVPILPGEMESDETAYSTEQSRKRKGSYLHDIPTSPRELESDETADSSEQNAKRKEPYLVRDKKDDGSDSDRLHETRGYLDPTSQSAKRKGSSSERDSENNDKHSDYVASGGHSANITELNSEKDRIDSRKYSDYEMINKKGSYLEKDKFRQADTTDIAESYMDSGGQSIKRRSTDSEREKKGIFDSRGSGAKRYTSENRDGMVTSLDEDRESISSSSRGRINDIHVSLDHGKINTSDSESSASKLDILRKRIRSVDSSISDTGTILPLHAEVRKTGKSVKESTNLAAIDQTADGLGDGASLRNSSKEYPGILKRHTKSSTEVSPDLSPTSSVILNLTLKQTNTTRQVFIRSLDSDAKYIGEDGVILVNTKLKPKDKEIRIRINEDSDMTIQLKKAATSDRYQSQSYNNFDVKFKTDTAESNWTQRTSTVDRNWTQRTTWREDNTPGVSRSEHTLTTNNHLRQVLSSIYVQDLVPVQHVIMKLKAEVNELAGKLNDLQKPGTVTYSTKTCNCLKKK